MADQFIYETALSDNTTEHTPFCKRDWIYINDTNSGSYAGTIQFDTAAAANSGKYVNWSGTYLMIPFTIVSKNNTDISAIANAYTCGLRNGSHQLINHLQISYNGTSVVQQTNYLNHFVQYKLMTTYSSDDLVKSGSSCQFYPDTASSFRWSQAGASKDGNGISNNRVCGATNGSTLATVGTMADQVNTGLFQRCKQVLDFSTAGAAAAANGGGLLTSNSTGFNGGTPLISKDNAATAGRARFTVNAGTGAARVYYWELLANIPLKNLSDFMAQMPPLVKGALIQFNIRYNASSQTIAYDGTNVTLSAAVSMTGLTNPLIVTSAASVQPNAATFGGATSTQTFACGVVSATDGTNSRTNSLMSVCRLYLPLYTLTGAAEEQLLKLHPTRTIQYQDLYQYTVSAVSAGGSFSQLLSSSIVNPKTIVIIPYINKAMLPGNHASNPVYCSPFTTEGGTTSPLLPITNLSIQASGVNLWNSNQTYDFEAFNNELQSINAINGNKQWGLTSGLISETDFYHGYRYYVCDLQRRRPSEDMVPKSLTISGTNSSNATVDYLVFVTYGRSLTVESLTGALLV